MQYDRTYVLIVKTGSIPPTQPERLWNDTHPLQIMTQSVMNRGYSVALSWAFSPRPEAVAHGRVEHPQLGLRLS
jgi:hypothetical protein